MILNNGKKNNLKVRFAPSPTGSLHIGSARTAIINYLFSKANSGTFVLRIEDTDILRSTEESKAEILNILKWLGVEWNEGPYFQSQRIEVYKKYINKLLETNKAYKCFCTSDELEKIRKEFEMKGKIPRYDGRCRNLTNSEIKMFEEQKKQYVVRLKMPEGDIKFTDIIKGEITFKSEFLDDIIIARSDGTPTYNFAVSVDDALMEISCVIRGEDHVSNTPKQIAIYNALGFEVPQFAHIPLILGPDRTKLSKRHCDTAIEDYKEKGYLPSAIFNYLALLGYSHDTKDEIISKEDLIKNFDISKISKSPSQFDINKLTWINSQYIQNSDKDILWKLCKDYLKNIHIEEEKLKKIFLLSIPQLKVLSDIKKAVEIFITYEEPSSNPQVIKLLYLPNIKEFLKKYFYAISNLQKFNKEELENLFNEIKAKFDIKNRDAIQIIRFASTGRSVSPPIFDTLELIGKDESIRRIQIFLNKTTDSS